MRAALYALSTVSLAEYTVASERRQRPEAWQSSSAATSAPGLTGLTPPTSAPALGSPVPHLRRTTRAIRICAWCVGVEGGVDWSIGEGVPGRAERSESATECVRLKDKRTGLSGRAMIRHADGLCCARCEFAA